MVLRQFECIINISKDTRTRLKRHITKEHTYDSYIKKLLDEKGLQ